MKKILFIINQKSGTNRRKAPEKIISKKLDSAKFTYEIAYTEYAGHAREIAKKAAEDGFDIVAVIGGDGSVNEVACGIYGSESVLAVIPQGSGNGLAHTLGITRGLQKAITIINKEKIKRIDAGFANGQLFLSNAGVGFDAYIARRFAKNKGRGLINYALLVISTFKKFKAREYQLDIDGRIYLKKAFCIAVANSNQFGYNFKIAPNARVDDDLLDICIIKPLHMINLPTILLRSLAGNFINSRLVKHYKGKNIFISEAGMNWMQLDGDAVDIRENNFVKITVKQQVLPVMVP